MLEIQRWEGPLQVLFSKLWTSPITWISKKELIVVLSSIALEYVMLSKAIQEAIELMALAKDNGLGMDISILISFDNGSSTHLAKNAVFQF